MKSYLTLKVDKLKNSIYIIFFTIERLKMDISVEVLKRAAPRSVKDRIDQDIVDLINNVSTDEQFREIYRSNLIGYIDVLQDGKFKIQDYVNATKYCSYKLMGNSNIQSYTKTFPERFDRLVKEGASDKDISAYVAAYNKNQLVNRIMEQSMIPTHVLNADLFQKAINVQAQIMTDHNASYNVRSNAANSLMLHLKPPEVTKIKLDVGIQNDGMIDELRKTTAELAAQQKKLIEAGLVNTKDIAESKIIEGEIV